MRPRFREDKATQAAAILIESSGGKINYMILLKLLYLADRTALVELGQPITFDSYVSMSKGPVLSTTYDLIRKRVGLGEGQWWQKHISAPSGYVVSLAESPGTDNLSDAEFDILHRIHEQYGHISSEWELVNLRHCILPEWKDPKGSSIPIEYEDILRVEGKNEAEVEAIRDELDLMAYVDERLSQGTVQG